MANRKAVNGLKECTKCKRKLIEEKEFSAKSKHNNYFASKCRWCFREDRKSEHHRERDWSNSIKMKPRKAHQRLRDAVRRGLITKPVRCEKCLNQFPKRLICGHHHNGYDNFFDVKWLCHSCHGLAHMVQGAGPAHSR